MRAVADETVDFGRGNEAAAAEMNQLELSARDQFVQRRAANPERDASLADAVRAAHEGIRLLGNTRFH